MRAIRAPDEDEPSPKLIALLREANGARLSEAAAYTGDEVKIVTEALLPRVGSVNGSYHPEPGPCPLAEAGDPSSPAATCTPACNAR